MTSITTTTPTVYQIFDSMDKALSGKRACASDLYGLLDMLYREAEDDCSNVTYAIAAIMPNGDVTFDI